MSELFEENSDYRTEWKSYIKAEISYVDLNGTEVPSVLIAPIQRIRRRGTKPKTVVDSTHKGNAGVIHKFPRYTWEITIHSTSEALVHLQYCKKHNIAMTLKIEEEAETVNGSQIGMTANSWVMASINYEAAWVDDISETFVVNDVPVVTVTGIALREITKEDL